MDNYDLVVVGGGTAGCAAAYMAGKLGLNVAIIEKNSFLGGAITSALVIPAMKSLQDNLNTEFYNDLVIEMQKIGGQYTYEGNPGWFNPELLKITLDKMLTDVHVKIYFNTTVSNLTCKDRIIKSLNLCSNILSPSIDKIHTDNQHDFQDILSVCIGTRYLVDSTGNSEIFKKLNCEFLENENNFQPFSLRFMMGGINLKEFAEWLLSVDSDRSVTSAYVIGENVHLSTACTWDNSHKWALYPYFEQGVKENLLKPSDINYFQVFTVPGMTGTLAFNCPRIVDYEGILALDNVSMALIEGRSAIYRLAKFLQLKFPGFKDSYIQNIANDLGIRVSDRIKGKYVYTMDDIISGKTFEHPVAIADYPIDVHSKEKNSSTLKKVQKYQIPIESLLSADYDNLFAAGRNISADFMAQGAIRIQPTCFSMGEGIARYVKSLITA